MAQSMSHPSIDRTVPVLPLPDYINHREITTAESETVPAEMYRVVISSDTDVWFRKTNTAVVPSSDVTDGTGSGFLKAGVPICFAVAPTMVISVVAASGTAQVSFWYYAK